MTEWATLRKYATTIDAELDRQVLEQAGIPVLVKGPETGIFGPGFSGATTHGVALLVPPQHLEEAQDLLGPEA